MPNLNFAELIENNKDSVEEKAKIHRVRLREAPKPLRRSQLYRLFYTKLGISLQEEFVPNIVVGAVLPSQQTAYYHRPSFSKYKAARAYLHRVCLWFGWVKI